MAVDGFTLTRNADEATLFRSASEAIMRSIVAGIGESLPLSWEIVNLDR